MKIFENLIKFMNKITDRILEIIDEEDDKK